MPFLIFGFTQLKGLANTSNVPFENFVALQICIFKLIEQVHKYRRLSGGGWLLLYH